MAGYCSGKYWNFLLDFRHELSLRCGTFGPVSGVHFSGLDEVKLHFLEVKSLKKRDFLVKNEMKIEK